MPPAERRRTRFASIVASIVRLCGHLVRCIFGVLESYKNTTLAHHKGLHLSTT